MKYTVKVTSRSPRPRSKRLREQGIGGAVINGGTVVTTGSGVGAGPSGDGHTHANKPSLDQITTNDEGYLLLTQLLEKLDPVTGAAVLEEVTRKVKAGYADEAGSLTGVKVYQDDDGNWHLETDYVDVRMKLTAKEVEIQTVYHIAGAQIKSSANMKCVKVEELQDVYRCYMNVKDDDGNEIRSMWRPNDQAYVQTFNLVKQSDGTVGNHFVWALVTAVGPDYIDVSKSVKAIGSNAPKAGDDIVQLGYRGTDDASRQVAVIDAGAGSDAPYYRQFVGIKSFDLPEPETQLKPGGNKISGVLHIQPGSTGWRDLEGLPDEIKTAADAAAQASKEAADAQKAADAAQKDADSAAGRLDEWAADGKISPTEKLTLKQELKQLEAEYTDKLGECQKYGVTDTASYTAAWNAYKAQLVAHSADTPENIPVSKDFATTQAAFYKARTALLAAIADAAKNFVDLSIAGIAVGAVNILRNSGFNGDYLSDELTASTEMSADKQLYSEALKHWSGIATVANDTASVSGKSAAIGSLSQPVKLITGEKYVISFKAKGSQVAVSCGNFNQSQALTSAYQKYVFKFTFGGTGVFVLSGTATICDLQLERGTIATEWSPSPLDNNKDISHMQAFEYLVSAIKEGSVDILGGLVLANMIQLGNYKDGKMQQVTAGVSGIYNDGDDVAFWAGGNFQQAINTVMKFKENPGYQPTDAEWGQLANFVATHGGDLFLRGYIYALGGLFRGRFETSLGGKRIVIDPDKQAVEMYTESGMLALCINFDTTDDGWDIGRITANKWINKQLALQTIIRSTSVSIENKVEGTYADINPNWVTFIGAKQETLQVGLVGIYDKLVLQKRVAYVHSEHWPSKSEAAPGTVYIDWDQNDMGLTGTGTLKIKSK